MHFLYTKFYLSSPHDIAEILLKLVLNTNLLINHHYTNIKAFFIVNLFKYFF